MADEKVEERLARMEERLIAERSVRKTRDDQLFKFISQQHKDMEHLGGQIDEISKDMKQVGQTIAKIDQKVDNQSVLVKKLEGDQQASRDTIREMQGSFTTAKWVIPILLTILAGALALLMANIDLRINQRGSTEDSSVTQPIEAPLK